MPWGIGVKFTNCAEFLGAWRGRLALRLQGGVNVECLYCKGTLVREKVSYAATRKGYHLIIDDVPVWVCEQCGEPLFDEETVDAIQEML